MPDLPPATSPRESELFSPASLCLPVASVEATAPALTVALPLAWALPLSLALTVVLALP